MSDIQEKIQEELKKAREVCSTEGSTAGECAAAWDVVEELQAEASHQKEKEPEKTYLERYCEDNPNAAECRLYED